MSSLFRSNRAHYVTKYNEDRADPEIREERGNKPLQVPEWLWRERALYTLDPPVDERDWDPTPEKLEAQAVCITAKCMILIRQVVEGAALLKKGIMLDTQDWRPNAFGNEKSEEEMEVLVQDEEEEKESSTPSGSIASQ